MKVHGNYIDNGHALIKGVLDPRVVGAALQDIKNDTAPGKIPLSQENAFAPVLSRAAFEVYGPYYTPLKFLLWGLTPIMESLVKLPLEPTYDYFRVYRAGDVCKVHSDRPACEHSMSLTLAYSDELVWPFHVGREAATPSGIITDDFSGSPFAALSMQPGDAVIYKGVEVRHGRIDPNPNAWSAHVFLHWVERGGRYADSAFECGSPTGPVDFAFT